MKKSKKVLSKKIGYIFLASVLGITGISTITIAGNIYNNAELKDINLNTFDFKGYPIKVNISKYYDYKSNTYKKGKLNSNDIRSAKFMEIIFEDGNKIIVPTDRIKISTDLGGKYNIDSDIIVDMPLYLKKKIDYGYVVNADVKLINNKAQDINNAFLLDTGIPYEEGSRTIWLVYNTNNVTAENQFLPRKVLVKLYDGTKLIKTQVIDVFKEGKLFVNLKEGEKVTSISKENFYVVGNTDEKNYWYANGPVIKSIDCPDKITTATTCKVNIAAFDAGTVKIYIKNKYNDDKYQFWSWDIQPNGGTVVKEFQIDPKLGYPDGEYIIVGQTFKNGILQQTLDDKEFVIDRYKPSFAEVFPTLSVADDVTGSAVIDVKVSERLKADPIGLKCDFPVTAVKRDHANPFLYHITVDLPTDKNIKAIKCYLKDVGLNTNTQYLFLKRYKDGGNMGIKDITPITNGLKMKVSLLSDDFIPTKINSLGSGKVTVCDGNCSGNVVGIESYQNEKVINKNSILISGGSSGNTVYKLFPDTEIFNSGYKNKITSITSDYIGNYWLVDEKGNYYKNGTYLGNKRGLTYYNIYKGSYIIEYYKGDGLYIDTQKIDFPSDYLGVDIVKPIDTNDIYLVGLRKDSNNKGVLDYYKIDLLNKKAEKILTVNVGKDISKFKHVDFAYYLDKIIILADSTDNRSYMAVMPLPEILIKNPETGTIISYVAHGLIPLKLGKELYEDLGLKALVKGYVLPKVEDCGADKKITIGGKEYKFDNNDWCNLEELNLDNTEDYKAIEPKMYYEQKLDDYIFKRKFELLGSKFGVIKELGEKELTLQNQPVEYWLGFVKASDVFTNENSPGWDYIKYDDKTFLSLPEIVHYSVDEDLKNDGFYIYKKNVKIQTLRNKTGLYLPVVVYKTPYNTSEVRILGVETKTDYITDPKTGQYKAVKRVLSKKVYKIDTVPPVFFDIKSSNTSPKVGDIVTISFKTTEPVKIKDITIGDVSIYDSSKVTKIEKNGIYYYELPDIKIAADMFDDQNQLWLKVEGWDQANNYNERKVNIAGLEGGISVSTLQAGKINTAGDVTVKNVLITNDKEVENMKNIDVLTEKKLITNEEIGVKLPRKSDGSIDFDKLFGNVKRIDILETYKKSPSYLQNYFVSVGDKACTYTYVDAGNEFRLNGDCGFIRNRVYVINGDLRITSPLKYKGFTTLFVNGDVYVDANILSAVDDKQNILGIIATGNIYVSPNVTNLQAVLKTEKNIYILK